MPSEKEQFQHDLLESVRQMRAGEALRVTRVETGHISISLSLPADVIERWQATGPDWLSRMAQLLSESSPQPAP